MRATKPAAALALVAVFGCASVRVQVDYDRDEDFSGYRSFAWHSRPSGAGGPQNELIGPRVRAAVERELRAKGFATVLAGTPDFYIFYHLSLERKLDIYSVNRGYIDSWGYYVAWPETRTRQYEEGTLIIDIVDAIDKELTWRGIGVGRVRRNPAPGQTGKDIDQAVADILRQFPPKQKSG